MIAKAVKGRGFRGALAYDLSKDEGRILDTNMAGEGVRELAAEFGAIRKLRPNLEKAVLHVSLSAAPAEKLSDAQWQAIGRRYLSGMELVANQYLITRHTDTEHEHIHILANRITNAGQVVSDSKDYQRQEALMREIEREYGLRQLAPSIESARRAPSRGEIEKQVRTAEVSTRIQLQQLADAAAKGCSSYSEYQERLEAAGVELVPVLQLGGAKLSGLMYRLDGVTMKGSDLGKGYSPAGLAKRGVSYEQERDAAAIRRGHESEAARGLGESGPGAAGRESAERRGAEPAARAAGESPGHAERGRGPGLDRHRQQSPGDGRRLQAPARPGERAPERSDDAGERGGSPAEPGGRATRLEPLRHGGDDRGDLSGARERILALVPAANRPEPGGRQGAGRSPEAGLDRGPSPEASQRQVAVELRRQVAKRDEQVRRVLAKAEQRQARREGAMQRLAEKRPEPPRGLLATFRQRGQEEAVAAWERAKALAWKLAQEAKQLVQRLSEIAAPEAVRRWAHALVQRRWPVAAAQHDKAQDKAQETERTSKADVTEERRQVDPSPGVRAAPRQSDAVLGLQKEWVGVRALRDKANSQPLTLTEKRELARGWDALAQLIDAGHRPATSEERQALDAIRLQAHRQVAAAEFLSLPQAEAVRRQPRLADAYATLATIDEKAKADGLTATQRELLRERSRQRLAQAIERGEPVQVRLKEQVGTDRQIQEERGKGRGQGPQR